MNLRTLIFGSPMQTVELGDQRLPKVAALPVFGSDALSSVAYATEEILLVLVVAGSMLLHLSLSIALIICGLLAIITLSYRQTIYAYPRGGGSYLVAHENLGPWFGLVAAAALMIDYILTVAVSISAGVRALASAFPALLPHSLALCLVAVALMAWANLRGVRESAAVLSVPTYGFILLATGLVVAGLWHVLFGHPAALPAPAPAAHLPDLAPAAVLVLCLRAFASGCTAMTGIEAVSNGVPVFRKPESRNASLTLIWLAAILASLFVGITWLARALQILPAQDESVLSQIARQVFGSGPLYLAVQIFTMLILVLAANTSFAGFPRLASILAEDGYLPRQLTNLGDRLAFSNGIMALAIGASVLLVLFGASTHALIPLYCIGVFLAFVLSQSGMVVWWFRNKSAGWRWKAAINGLGAVTTAIALLVIVDSKFIEGAWIIVLLVPIILLMFAKIRQHYGRLSQQLSPRMGGLGDWLPWLHRMHPKVVVPVSKMHPGTLAALQLARTMSDDVTAVMVDLDRIETARLRLAWRALRFEEKLVVLDSPYRSVIAPLMAYLDEVDRREPERGRAVVVLPEFVPEHWWQNLLHNQTALLLKAELLFRKMPEGGNRIVIDVPYRLRSAA